MESIKSKLSETFDKCQERRNNLAKVSDTLKKYFLTIKDEVETRISFVKEFLFYVECLLQESCRDSGVERCVQFIAIFSSQFADTCEAEDNVESLSVNNEESLYNVVISHISKPEIHCHSNKTVRFRVCQLMQHLLGAVPQNAALDEDLMDNVTKVMLDRVQDKSPMVRAQAARALNRLQQPSVRDCPVIEEYLFHLACDDSPVVRGAVLSNISLTTKTLPCVLDRTRDVSENVRITAFQIISQKVSIKALNSSQRLYLIKQGLLDRSEAVREVVKKQLFQAWLLTFNANLLDLLKKLDVVGAHDTCCKAVVAMFECSSLSDLMDGFTLLNEKKLIDENQLTPESALYWLQLCEFMRRKGVEGDRYLDLLLPSTLTFAEYMEEYFNKFLDPFISRGDGALSPEEEDDKIEKEFVAEQLVKIAIKMDLSDNAGRQKLNKVFRSTITTLEILCFPCLLPPLVSGLLHLQSSNSPITSEESDKVEIVASMIAMIREPRDLPAQDVILTDDVVSKIKQKLAKITVELNEANEELQESVANKDFVKAGALQLEIDAAMSKKEDLLKQLEPVPAESEVASLPEKSDTGTLVKCLIIFKETLSSIFECRCLPHRIREKPPRDIPPTMLQLFDTLVTPSVLNQSAEVRKQAVRSMGVACMFSAPLAARHFTLLMQIAQADHFVVRVAAINAVNDLTRMFGVKALTPKKEAERPSDDAVDENNSEASDPDVDDNHVTDMSQAMTDKFVDMLEDEEIDVRVAAASLLCSVLISHRILSPGVVSRLILQWYDPSTRDEPPLLNTISSFLDVFPYMSKEAHECVQASLLPVLRVLFNAPATSPFAAVNVGNVAELIVSLTAPSIVEKADLSGLGITRDIRWLKEKSAHDDFAVTISNEILSDPTSPFVNTLSKILCLLDLNPSFSENIRDLQVLSSNMLSEVTDKQAIRHVRKFQTQLSSLAKLDRLRDHPRTESDERIRHEQALDEEARKSVLKPINVDPSTPKSSQFRKTSSQKNPVLLGNPKRNLSNVFVDVAD